MKLISLVAPTVNIKISTKDYERAGAYGIDVSAEKSKIIMNSTTNTSALNMMDRRFRLC
ncbi:hypothetical protein DPMN_176517 [Dreissena polymorpha]|uniref:Uncharacterized protein n=1 Tax=Dreissena polymorpha TaxID=45954 RepID=A0A9D4E9M6_DREPO|nr:hypothetical protein DPMN_176517 [Dreissena polymorpha]